MNTITKKRIIEIIILIFVVLNIFIAGRLYQIKKDKKVVDEISLKYKELANEYIEYKKHSYVLSTYKGDK